MKIILPLVLYKKIFQHYQITDLLGKTLVVFFIKKYSQASLFRDSACTNSLLSKISLEFVTSKSILMVLSQSFADMLRNFELPPAPSWG